MNTEWNNTTTARLLPNDEYPGFGGGFSGSTAFIIFSPCTNCSNDDVETVPFS